MDLKIPEEIWEHTGTPESSPYLAFIDRVRGGFMEVRSPYWIWEQDEGIDLFFSPLTFVGDRKNQNAARFNALFADLDRHGMVIPPIRPTFMWTTSDANAQAVWLLHDDLTPDDWADLNQRLTYHLEADKGGWHASKLLRVPGSLNYKYQPPQQGKVIIELGPSYAAEALRDLPPVPKNGGHNEGWYPEPLPPEEWRRYVSKIYPDLTLGLQWRISSKTVRDRSLSLIMTINEMLALDYSPLVVFHVVWGLPWNKFRTDRWDPGYVWQLIDSR